MPASIEKRVAYLEGNPLFQGCGHRILLFEKLFEFEIVHQSIVEFANTCISRQRQILSNGCLSSKWSDSSAIRDNVCNQKLILS